MKFTKLAQLTGTARGIAAYQNKGSLIVLQSSQLILSACFSKRNWDSGIPAEKEC
jgi:hypothetical protein